MEKFIISLEPSEGSECKQRSFIHTCRDSDAARDYAKVLLSLGCGNFHRAIVQSQWKSDSFQQCIDPIVFNSNL